MRYAQIREMDIANGEGIRTSLYVQGCRRHCPFCFNKETWDFDGGRQFTDDLLNKIIELTNRPHIKGLTILGGEPLEPENYSDVVTICRRVKEECPDRDIWLYTSYTWKYLKHEHPELLELVDVIVDGEFINDKRDPALKFRGSTNQRVIDVKKTMQLNNGYIALKALK